MSNSKCIKLIDCLYCDHFTGKNVGKDLPLCKAFPDGIPAEILAMTVKHDKPYTGDKGLQFKPKKP